MERHEVPVSVEDKREALELALHSNTFSRSSQLRAFLKHICELELEGRAEELTEYEIAVAVLGRPKDINLAEDSSVRNRAYELRQRLEKLYSSECATSSVRIEVPRGGYVPVYTRHSEPRAADPVSAPSTFNDAAVEAAPSMVQWIAGAAVLIVAAMSVGWWAGTRSARAEMPAVLAEAWGPMADTRNDLLISIATNLHMLVRPHMSERALKMPAPEPLYRLFRETRPLADGEALYMEPAQLSVPLGEVVATTTLARTRAMYGGTYEILPEADTPVPVLMGRNAVLLGTPINSNAASFFLGREPLTVGVLPGTEEFAIIDQRKPSATHPQGTPVYVAQWRNGLSASTTYGLLTVMTHDDPSGRTKRLVSVTGTGSASNIQAGVEFYCSAERMRALKARFAASGYAGFPPNYQVVIRCETQGVRLVSYEYATHVVAGQMADPAKR